MSDISNISEEEFLKADDIAAKAAQQYADHVYAMKIYEGMCKDYLAALKMEFRSKGAGKASQAELECIARASEEWKEFREQRMEILKEAGRKEVLYENAKRRWETARSNMSLKREEIKRFKG